MERRLLTLFIPADEVPAYPGESTDLILNNAYQNWRLVSHTYQLVDGGAVLSLVVEQL